MHAIVPDRKDLCPSLLCSFEIDMYVFMLPAPHIMALSGEFDLPSGFLLHFNMCTFCSLFMKTGFRCNRVDCVTIVSTIVHADYRKKGLQLVVCSFSPLNLYNLMFLNLK